MDIAGEFQHGAVSIKRELMYTHTLNDENIISCDTNGPAQEHVIKLMASLLPCWFLDW